MLQIFKSYTYNSLETEPTFNFLIPMIIVNTSSL